MIIKSSAKFISLVIISIFLSQMTYSQSKGWISEFEMPWLDNLDYKKPDGFKEVMGDDCFEDNPKLRKILYCGGNQLHADDGSSVIFTMFGTTYTTQPENEQMIIVGPPGQNRISGVLKTPIEKPKLEFTPETYFMSFVKQDLTQALSKEDAPQWRDHLIYYSKKDTKNKFNADLAFSYEIPLEPEDFYKGKYNNLWVLFLEKNGGFMRMYCFYKNMPNQELADYKEKIEGTFKYKN